VRYEEVDPSLLLEVIRLRKVEGLSHKKIAARTPLSEYMVRKILLKKGLAGRAVVEKVRRAKKRARKPKRPVAKSIAGRILSELMDMAGVGTTTVKRVLGFFEQDEERYSYDAGELRDLLLAFMKKEGRKVDLIIDHFWLRYHDALPYL